MIDGAAIGVVVLNWNGGASIMDTIASLFRSEEVRIRVVVIDNHSTDGSTDALRQKFPAVTVIVNASNVGVAAGFAQGMAWCIAAGLPYVFFLNSDATVDPTCLAALLQVMSGDTAIGMCTPRILDASRPGRLWFDGGRINSFGYPVHAGFGTVPEEETHVREEDFATGCAMMVAAGMVKQVGTFETSYFAYSEDADLSFRARAAGYRIVHVPYAVASHVPSVSVRENAGKWLRDYYVTRNALYLRGRFPLKAPGILFHGYFLGKYLLALPLYYCLTAQWRRVAAVYKGLWDFLHNVSGALQW